MVGPVTIENEALRMEVWPAFGGKIASLIDKADNHELLFNYPAELPSSPQYDISYGKSWDAGWDEFFPAIGAGKYSGHPYDGIPIPDHGELWGLPTTAVPTQSGITTVWQGLRFGYRLVRKLVLEGPVLRAEYTLMNLAPFEFRFVWAPSAMLSIAGAPQVRLPPSGAFRLSHDADGNALDQPIEWPMVGEGLDLSRPGELPERRAWKVFAHDPITAPAQVIYPSRGRSFSIEFASEQVSAYWGVWVNTCGWAGQYHFAIQPTTGRYDQIHRACHDGSAATVGPAGRCDWSMTWRMIDHA